MGRTATGFEWRVPSLAPSVSSEREAWVLVGQGTDWAALVSTNLLVWVLKTPKRAERP